MISKGFYEQLETIASERHIEIEDVLTAVRTALIKACQLEGCKGAIEVEFNEEQKNVRIFENFIVVEEVDPEGPEGQITLDEAKELRARVRVGSEFRHEVKFSQIGRKGATRFKQIFIQGLKELGGKRAYEYFKEKEGEVVNATVIKKTDSVVGLSLGMDVVTFMPLEEILPGEKCEPGMQMKVCITKVEETGKGPKVFVSRSNRDLIKRLFELNEALAGERIDIFNWSDNPIILIAEALTPAKVISVLINEETKKSTVIVPDDQFSLAIGKGGQNVRLASQTTGWRIDIKDETAAYREGISFKPNVYGY